MGVVTHACGSKRPIPHNLRKLSLILLERDVVDPTTPWVAQQRSRALLQTDWWIVYKALPGALPSYMEALPAAPVVAGRPTLQEYRDREPTPDAIKGNAGKVKAFRRRRTLNYQEQYGVGQGDPSIVAQLAVSVAAATARAAERVHLLDRFGAGLRSSGNASGGSAGNAAGGSAGNAAGSSAGNATGGSVGNAAGGSAGNAAGGSAGNAAGGSAGGGVGQAGGDLPWGHFGEVVGGIRVRAASARFRGLPTATYPQVYRELVASIPVLGDTDEVLGKRCALCGRCFFDVTLVTKGKWAGQCTVCRAAARPGDEAQAWSVQNKMVPGPRIRLWSWMSFLERMMVARIRNVVWIYSSTLGVRKIRSHSFATAASHIRVLTKLPALPGNSLITYNFTTEAERIAREDGAHDLTLRRDFVLAGIRAAVVGIPDAFADIEFDKELATRLPVKGSLFDLASAHAETHGWHRAGPCDAAESAAMVTFEDVRAWLDAALVGLPEAAAVEGEGSFDFAVAHRLLAAPVRSVVGACAALAGGCRGTKAGRSWLRSLAASWDAARAKPPTTEAAAALAEVLLAHPARSRSAAALANLGSTGAGAADIIRSCHGEGILPSEAELRAQYPGLDYADATIVWLAAGNDRFPVAAGCVADYAEPADILWESAVRQTSATYVPLDIFAEALCVAWCVEFHVDGIGVEFYVLASAGTSTGDLNAVADPACVSVAPDIPRTTVDDEKQQAGLAETIGLDIDDQPELGAHAPAQTHLGAEKSHDTPLPYWRDVPFFFAQSLPWLFSSGDGDITRPLKNPYPQNTLQNGWVTCSDTGTCAKVVRATPPLRQQRGVRERQPCAKHVGPVNSHCLTQRCRRCMLLSGANSGARGSTSTHPALRWMRCSCL